VTQPRSSSSNSSEIPPESWPAKQIAREGGAVRYRARVEYDGTDFAGFAVQPGRRTVQGELERALTRLSAEGREVRVEGAGRTDAGVHAQGQVIAFTYAGRLPQAELERALEALLPADIGIGPLRRVAADYRPRYRTRHRTYRYSIWNGPPSPLRERHALGVREELDTAAMAAAGALLVGRHDFSAFGGRDRQPVRTLHRVEVRRRARTVTISVVGDAFLRQMVRRISAALMRVGRGDATPADVAAALATPSRPAFGGETAPARGLSLFKVTLGRPKRKMEQNR
jgi:tRNA pseudouridine38-40 synthase